MPVAQRLYGSLADIPRQPLPLRSSPAHQSVAAGQPRLAAQPARPQRPVNLEPPHKPVAPQQPNSPRAPQLRALSTPMHTSCQRGPKFVAPPIQRTVVGRAAPVERPVAEHPAAEPQSSFDTRRSWTPEEVGIFTLVINRSPSVHNIQPWSVGVSGRTVSLFDRGELGLGQHDPTGRDRMMSCGAALTNVELAMRQCGWSARRWIAESDTYPLVAIVTGAEAVPASAHESALFRAIAVRASHRQPFSSQPVSARHVHLLRQAVHAACETGSHPLAESQSARQLGGRPVQLQPVNQSVQVAAVARLLERSAAEHANNAAYQQELAAWTIAGRAHGAQRCTAGIPEDAYAGEGLGAAGLAARLNSQGSTPDAASLATALRRELVFVLTTAGDEHADHLKAGAAMQRVWLTATSLGLAASVMTQPVRQPEFRKALAAAMGTEQVPQLILRVGHRAQPAARSPRREATRLVGTLDGVHRERESARNSRAHGDAQQGSARQAGSENPSNQASQLSASPNPSSARSGGVITYPMPPGLRATLPVAS